MVMDDNKSHICNNKVSKSSQALSPVKLHKVKGGSYGQAESGGEGEGESPAGGEGVWSISRQEDNAGVHTSSSIKELRISQSHSKKVIKHALRQQAKRRRKNTTIAAGNSTPLPRIVMPPQNELEETPSRINYRPPTMMEVLSSIPGFSIKPRKRSNKKLSAAAQLEQTKEGCIDLETPDSILVNTNLRSLLNKHTFNLLPALYQFKLVQLLPHVDRTFPAGDSFRLSSSGLNNEFFARACLEWRERLAEGEFTPENQQKLKTEAEREKSKLDPWKLKHFEPIWGDSAVEVSRVDWTPPPKVPPKPRPPSKTKTPPAPPPPRLRTVGAITRAVANYREKREAEENSMLFEPNKRIKSSNHKPDNNVEASATSTSKSTSTAEMPVTPQPKTRETSRRNEEELRPPDEEMKEEPDKDEWTKDTTNQEGSKSEMEQSTKCEELNITDWENVEVISVDPVQEYVDVDTQVDKECDQLGESDKFVCDISASEDMGDTAESTAREEEVVTKDFLSVQEEESVTKKESLDEVEKEEVVKGKDEREYDDVSQNDDDTVIVSHEEVAENNPDATTVAVQNIVNSENLAVEYCNNENKNENPPCENYTGDNEENSQEIPQNNICDMLSDKDISEGDIFRVDESEHQKEPVTMEDSNSLVTEQCRASPFNENKTPLSQESVTDCNNVINEREEVKTISGKHESNQEENHTSEEKLSEAVVEDNINERRYDLEMSDISVSDHLHFVSQGTSQHASVGIQSNQELRNNQDSVDSQIETKEDQVLSYSVKMEREIDLQHNASNVQSMDSQDTRPDEESSCPQNSAAQLLLPNSEATVPGVQENVGSMRSDGTFSMYSNVLYQEALKEEVEAAALFAAAWGAVDSSTEKLLAQVALQEESEVNVIPMQEELEVRLEEIKSVPGWSSYGTRTSATLTQSKPTNSPQYPGPVKLELEVTLTPEVDSQVPSNAERGARACSSRSNVVPSGGNEGVKSSTSLTVIPPTTIVCLPSANPTVSTHPTPPTSQPPQGVVSSSAVPYLALTTSTPVRALPTKPKLSSGGSGGRSSRNVSTKPPPGAVNLERSYQICQAVIQNSPNRDQLRCQLKPPPSLLIGKSDKAQYGLMAPSRGARTMVHKHRTYQQRPTAPVLVKHVFTSSQGIPVTMAVLPHTQPTINPEVAESQMGHYVLVQRTGAQVRRSNSAPPSNNENLVGLGGRGRPASVGEGGGGSDSPIPGYYPNKHTMRSADCHCSLKAMIACKKCGAFCHDDCIDPSRVCVTCLIR